MTPSREPQLPRWRPCRPGRRPLALGLAAALLASCSAVHEHQLTPWSKLESRRPTLQIVHIWEGATEDRLLRRDGAGWTEALRSQRAPLTTLVLADGAGVVAHTRGGWLVFAPGTLAPTPLPVEACSTIAGHPSRPSVLCLGPAGSPDPATPVFDGPRLLELGLDGSVLAASSLESPKARVRNGVIGGTGEGGAVLVLVTLPLEDQRSECLLYDMIPGGSRLRARWPGEPWPAISCPWGEKAEAAAGKVTRAIHPERRY